MRIWSFLLIIFVIESKVKLLLNIFFWNDVFCFYVEVKVFIANIFVSTDIIILSIELIFNYFVELLGILNF